MSLKSFHIVFIVCSTLLCAGFGVYAIRRSVNEGLADYLFLGLISLAVAIGLVIYGIKFFKKLILISEL